MERRHFLKLTFGFVAGAAALATGVMDTEAAPLPPVSPEGQGLVPQRGERAEPAVATQDDVDRLAPEEVRWRRRWGYRRRYWGYRRRRFWRRRYWGYRRRRVWRRRFWRRRYYW